jgi:hypothetical protein
MAPKWQRARITHVERPQDLPAVGQLVWVAGRPEPCNDPYCIWCKVNGPGFVYRESNVGCNFSADFLELLARDESDFAEDVPFISWQEFIEAAKERPADD